MELDVDPGKFLDRVGLHGLFIAPEPPGRDKLAELRSVVAKVVEPDDVIAEL